MSTPSEANAVVNVVADSTAFMLADLKRSGLMPADFPIPPTPLSSVDGVRKYRINYASGYWKTRYDRAEVKYLGPKGKKAEVYWPQAQDAFNTSTTNASVEGEKSAQTFVRATGIATAGLPGCWGFGESIALEFEGADPTDDDGPQRALRQELIAGFGSKRVHLILIDGDWASNPQVARALSTFAWEVEHWGSEVVCIDLGFGPDGKRLGFDDWMVQQYGADSAKWPSQDTVRRAVFALPRIDVETLPTADSWFLESNERFNGGHIDFSDRGNTTLWLRLMGRNNVRYLTDLKKWIVWDTEAKRWGEAPDNPLELVNCAARRRRLYGQLLMEQSKKILQTVPPVEGAQEKSEALAQMGGAWLKSASALSSNKARENVLKDARGRDGVTCTALDFDHDPDVLAVANGVVDLRTGELRDEVQEDMIRKRCAAAYTGDEPQGAWAMKAKTFLQQITAAAHGHPDPDNARWLQRRMGAGLRGRCSLGSLEIFHGEGANGKSVLLTALQETLGTYAISLPAGVLMASFDKRSAEAASPFLVRAVGCRFVFAVETKDTDHLDESKVKMLTGVTDKLTVRGNYQAGGEYTVSFTTVLAANTLPKVAQGDNALWDRLAPLSFRCRWQREGVLSRADGDSALPVADLDLRDRMPHEADAQAWILWWLVQGGVEWTRNGLGLPPAYLKEAADEYKESQDVLGRWLDGSRFELDAEAKVLSGELYADYSEFMRHEGAIPPKQPVFTDRLKARWKTQGVQAVKSNGMRYLKGFRRKTAQKY